MRKLFGLLAAVGFVVGISAPASSAVLTLTGSSLDLTIGALPAISVPQSPDPLLISVGGTFIEPANLFAATGVNSIVLPTQLFTGVSLISSFNASFANLTKNVNVVGGTASGGTLNGTATIGVLGGLVNLFIPLNVIGGGGVAVGGAASLAVTVTGSTLWTTGTAKNVGITTTTPLGAVLNTVTVSGSNNLNSVSGGTITLVTPVRILTNAAGNLPGFAIQRLTFAVPEPGTLLLIGSGIVGLGLVGRRKLRK